MDLPRNMSVDINIQNKVLLLTSDEGDVARIDPGYFADCPRKAIRLADVMAKAPEMHRFVMVATQILGESDAQSHREIAAVGKTILKSIDEAEDAG